MGAYGAAGYSAQNFQDQFAQTLQQGGQMTPEDIATMVPADVDGVSQSVTTHGTDSGSPSSSSNNPRLPALQNQSHGSGSGGWDRRGLRGARASGGLETLPGDGKGTDALPRAGTGRVLTVY